MQRQNQKHRAHQAGHDGKAHVKIGITGPPHGKGHGIFDLERQFAGKSLGIDKLGRGDTPIKTGGIADGHDRGAVRQRHPQHAARHNAFGQRFLGLPQDRHKGRDAAQRAEGLGDLERRHVHVGELHQRDGLEIARHRQVARQRRIADIAAEGIAILHPVPILDQHLLHVEAGLDRHLHIGHESGRAERGTVGQDAPQGGDRIIGADGNLRGYGSDILLGNVLLTHADIGVEQIIHSHNGDERQYGAQQHQDIGVSGLQLTNPKRRTPFIGSGQPLTDH